MPTYQYRCTECGHDLEAVQKFTDASLTVCPNCGGELRKVFNAVGVVFKGSGFYRTDSRRSEPGDGSAGAGTKKEAGSGENGSGTKKEAAATNGAEKTKTPTPSKTPDSAATSTAAKGSNSTSSTGSASTSR